LTKADLSEIRVTLFIATAMHFQSFLDVKEASDFGESFALNYILHPPEEADAMCIDKAV